MISPDELIRLWTEHGAALEMLARTRCPSPEDCVQTAFIKLAARRVTPNDPVAWLARVVRNAAIDQSRTDSRRRERERTFAIDFAEATETSNPLDFEYTPDEVASALLAIDVESREVVMAHIWGKMTFRQIADAFDVSSSVAHRRYTTAIKELREHLKTDQRIPVDAGEQP